MWGTLALNTVGAAVGTSHTTVSTPGGCQVFPVHCGSGVVTSSAWCPSARRIQPSMLSVIITGRLCKSAEADYAALESEDGLDHTGSKGRRLHTDEGVGMRGSMRPLEFGVVVDDGSGVFKAAFSKDVVFGLSFWRVCCCPWSARKVVVTVTTLAALFW